MAAVIGKIHSIETLGTRDGPGLRCVFFMAGCCMRCRFCHNPDTFTDQNSRLITIEEAEETITSLLPYLRQRGGGITASGGEPTLQADFVRHLFKLGHSLNITTVLDTNGMCPPSKIMNLLKVTDMVLLDIKACDPNTHKYLTGQSNKNVLEFARLVSTEYVKKKTPKLVIRRVIVPGVNDSRNEMLMFSSFLTSLAAKPEVELIGYHTMGKHKWEALGLEYTLSDIRAATDTDINRIRFFLMGQGVKVLESHG